jgi:hypothetical protein
MSDHLNDVDVHLSVLPYGSMLRSRVKSTDDIIIQVDIDQTTIVLDISGEEPEEVAIAADTSNMS